MPEFNFGDHVRFKSWIEMQKEFGLDTSCTAINCAYYFTGDMDMEINREKIYTIDSYDERGVVEFKEDDIPAGYIYTLDMIKPANEVKEECL